MLSWAWGRHAGVAALSTEPWEPAVVWLSACGVLGRSGSGAFGGVPAGWEQRPSAETHTLHPCMQVPACT